MTSLAYAPDPLPDEPLDGWIERIAAATLTTTSRVLNDLGLIRDGGLTRDSSLVRDLQPDDLHHIAEVAEVDAQILESLTLHRWTTLGLVPHKDERGHQGGGWARTKVGRYCPQCLDEREGIHRIHWRTVWSTACLRHRALLIAYDPTNPPYGDPRPLSAPHPLPADHPILQAQATIDSLLDNPATPLRSLGANQSAWQYLSDLGALTRALITTPDFSNPNGHAKALQERTGTDWTTLSMLFPPPRTSKSSAAHLGHAVRSPALTALAITTAQPVLAQPTTDPTAPALWWVTDTQRHAFRHQAARRGISYALSQALAPTHATTASGGFLLRFVLTRHDQQGRRLSPLDPSKLPSSAWTSVTQRPYRGSREIEGVAASAALLMIASDRRTPHVLEALGLQHLHSRITTDWNLSFDNTPDGDANFQQLLDLQRELATNPVPIDYARRRRLFPAATPLGRNTLKQLLKALDVREATLVPHCASWYLHELLTGSDFLIGRQGIDMFATHRATYRKWRARWQEEQPPAFHELAERQLHRHNIDEPATWRPERHHNAWVLPADDGSRHLNLWATSNRPKRARSLPAQGSAGMYSLESAVAFACRGEGQSAAAMRERLRRFAILAVSPSLTSAAATLKIAGTNLTVNMKSLERDLGRDLIDRSGLRNKLTRDGQKLKSLLDKEAVFRSPASTPPAPPVGDLPGIVAFAYEGQGTKAPIVRELLERFALISTLGLKDAAATSIGVSPSWLGQQMVRLETIVGEPLWQRGNTGVQGGRGGQARKLNATGRELNQLIQERSQHALAEAP